MVSDPILKEVHAMKNQLANQVAYDLHILCKRLREWEQQHPERLSPLRPIVTLSKKSENPG